MMNFSYMNPAHKPYIIGVAVAVVALILGVAVYAGLTLSRTAKGLPAGVTTSADPSTGPQGQERQPQESTPPTSAPVEISMSAPGEKTEVRVNLPPDITTASNPHRGGAGSTNVNAVLKPASLKLRDYPPVRKPFIDPVFGTTLVRFSDAASRNDYANHSYSQLQAFSADSRYLLLNEEGGSLVRRVDTGERTAMQPFIGNTVRWHQTKSDTIIHYVWDQGGGNVRFRFTNIETAANTDVFTFSNRYQRIASNQSFEDMSQDGRWVAGMAIAGEEEIIFALDTVNRRLGAQISVQELYRTRCERDPQYGVVEPNWIAPSPLGRYLVVNWSRDGIDGCSGQEVYDIETGRYIGHSYDGHQHGDLAVLPDGKTEVYVTVLGQSPVQNNIPALGYYELPNGAARPRFIRSIPWHGMEHISCRGPRGMCVVTSYAPEPDWALQGVLENEIYLVYFDGSIRRLAHHRSSDCGYWVQPRATISRDGRYIAFDSDFWTERGGKTSCEVFEANLGGGEVFFLLLPDEAFKSPGNSRFFAGFEGEVSSQDQGTGGANQSDSGPGGAPPEENRAPAVPLGQVGLLPQSSYTPRAGEVVNWELAESPWHLRLDHRLGKPDGETCFDDDFIVYDLYLAAEGRAQYTHVGHHEGGGGGSFINGHELESQGCNKGVMLYTLSSGKYRAAVCITNAKNKEQHYCSAPVDVTATAQARQ